MLCKRCPVSEFDAYLFHSYWEVSYVCARVSSGAMYLKCHGSYSCAGLAWRAGVDRLFTWAQRVSFNHALGCQGFGFGFLNTSVIFLCRLFQLLSSLVIRFSFNIRKIFLSANLARICLPCPQQVERRWLLPSLQQTLTQWRTAEDYVFTVPATCHHQSCFLCLNYCLLKFLHIPTSFL